MNAYYGENRVVDCARCGKRKLIPETYSPPILNENINIKADLCVDCGEYIYTSNKNIYEREREQLEACRWALDALLGVKDQYGAIHNSIKQLRTVLGVDCAAAH